MNLRDTSRVRHVEEGPGACEKRLVLWTPCFGFPWTGHLERMRHMVLGPGLCVKFTLVPLLGPRPAGRDLGPGGRRQERLGPRP